MPPEGFALYVTPLLGNIGVDGKAVQEAESGWGGAARVAVQPAVEPPPEPTQSQPTDDPHAGYDGLAGFAEPAAQNVPVKSVSAQAYAFAAVPHEPLTGPADARVAVQKSSEPPPEPKHHQLTDDPHAGYEGLAGLAEPALQNEPVKPVSAQE